LNPSLGHWNQEKKMSVFDYGKDSDGIVTITMDMTGPVNSMNEEYGRAMPETVAMLEAEEGLSGVVFTSAKKTFFAGGNLDDLLEFDARDTEDLFAEIQQAKAVMRRLELLPVPVVAAINGAALGGGYEICLCCNRRIAWNVPFAVTGLPEVTLGLLPGGGGVVRLPRMIGLQKALPYLLEGKRVKPAIALADGLIDEIVEEREDLVPRAKAWILENRDNPEAALQPWDRKGFRFPGGGAESPKLAQVIQIAPIMLLKKTRGLLPAPERILDIAVESLKLDLDTALRKESRAFLSLFSSPVTKNMITAFFFQMNKVNGGAARPADVPQSTVRKVGILGAGMMGQGIACVASQAGIDVVLKDLSLESAEQGKAYTAEVLDWKISRGRMKESAKTEVLDRIKATDQDDDLEGCDLIIEAVFEDMKLKNRITSGSEKFLAEDGIWGSNTSTLPITQLAEASAHPEKFIGIHFFSPVDRMPLVELICGEKTSDETLARAFDFVRQIRKTPIVVNDSLGFFTSRVFGTQLMEAAQMITEGLHPVRIDAMGRAIGMPVGPLTVHDEVSLKLSVEVMDTHLAMGLVNIEDDPTPAATQLLVRMVGEFGRGGRHYGGGYFEYGPDGKAIWPGLLENYYRQDVEIDDQDIKDRLLFRSVIESIKCLEEGVLRSVADGNIGSILGIGAPAWTGGYIQFVNTYGLERFIIRCDELAEQYGDRFRAPSVVIAKAEAGELFQ
jgi:3-hydroxyacyl-CoA dehydrogenase/enoyl-CoA hydratase/3-hydroxybutyryl-CoA epimerase